MNDIQKDTDIIIGKAKARVEPEIKALQAARREQNELSQRQLALSNRIDAARDEIRKLELDIEAALLKGDRPSAALRDRELKKAEAEAVQKMIDNLKPAMKEAADKVKAAETALSTALWREVPALRDEVELSARALFTEGVQRLASWDEAWPGLYAEHGIQPNRTQETRLGLFIGLLDVVKKLEPYIDTTRDALYAQAVKRERGIR
jgi:seryl-tRNA synthetase